MKIRIYQINLMRDTNKMAFRPYEDLKRQGCPFVDFEIYDKVFEGEVDCKTLEEVFIMFNTTSHPEGYKGRNLSVSDVVEVMEGGTDIGFYYCDSVGFKCVAFNLTGAAISQILNADNADEKCEHFAKVFFDSIETDDEPRSRCGRHMLKAILENSLDDFLIAACGWSAESLMKKATILRDTDGMFHDKIEDATFVSLWDGERYAVSTDCKVNTETFEVFDFEAFDFEVLDFDKASDSLRRPPEYSVLDGEYIELNGVRYPVIQKEHLQDGDVTSFWRE